MTLGWMFDILAHPHVKTNMLIDSRVIRMGSSTAMIQTLHKSSHFILAVDHKTVNMILFDPLNVVVSL
jgi:hypothetical protein